MKNKKNEFLRRKEDLNDYNFDKISEVKFEHEINENEIFEHNFDKLSTVEVENF